MRPALPVAALLLGALAWRAASGSASGADPAPATPAPERPIACFVPSRCTVFVDGSGLGAFLARGLEHPFVRALRASPLGELLLARLPGTPESWLERADAWLGGGALESAAEVSTRGLAFGFVPGAKHAVLVARGRATEAVTRVRRLVFAALERQLGIPGALARPGFSWSGSDVWLLGEAFLAQRGPLLVLGNDGDLVRDALALAADPEGAGLRVRPDFVALEEASVDTREAAPALHAWLALDEIEPHADQGFHDLRRANHEPAAQALLGARLAALPAGRALALDLALDASGAELVLRAHGASGIESLWPRARPGEIPAEPRPEAAQADIAHALVYRDYARFFAERAALFAPEVLGGFAQALTTGALFFEGRDLGAEVLPGLSPWIRLVVRAASFEPGREPEIPLPAVAAVAVLADERAGEAWLSAFQSLIAVIGVDRAQKGGQALRLVVGREGEAELTSGRFPTPLPGDGVDIRYNLQPALGVSGRHLVVGTHESLVRALLRELDGTGPAETTAGAESLELWTTGLRGFLERNAALLEARARLDDGLDAEAAAARVDGIRRALASFAGLRLELDASAGDAGATATPRVRLVVRFEPLVGVPAGARPSAPDEHEGEAR